MDAVEVCEKINQPYQKHGDYCITSCYNTNAHSNGDRKPSLTVYNGDRGYYCFSCGESGTHNWLLHCFGIDGDYRVSRKPKVQSYQEEETNPKNYKKYTDLPKIYSELKDIPRKYVAALEKKGWGVGDFQNTAGWRYHTGQIKKWGQGLFIPYFDLDGTTIISARLRLFNDEGPRFLGLPKGELFPYMWHNLNHDIVFVTEGETDCLTLMFCGIPAVGIPGSTNAGAIDKLMKEAAKRNTRLIAIPDNDDAGARFLDRLRISAFSHFVRIDNTEVPYPYKDVNDFYTGSDPDLFAKYFKDQFEDDLPQIVIPETTTFKQEKLL